MYELNEKEAKNTKYLYTDAMIYSPAVPIFRDGPTNALLLEPYAAGILTVPAPNAGPARKAGATEKEIEETL